MKLLNLTVLILVAGCQDPEVPGIHYGYVEARLAHIAPIPSGRITNLSVREGQQVTKDQLLFSIDPIRAEAALASARSSSDAARARLADLQKAGRPAEIRAAEQILVQRKANLVLANESLHRSETLVQQKLAPTARLDSDTASRDAALAGVEEAKARLSLLKQPARADQIVAAKASASQMQAQVEQTAFDLDQYQIKALRSAKVEILYRQTGELAGPTSPVLALLYPDQTRVRWFIPEPELQKIKAGLEVNLTCDGCAAGLRGKVSFIAGQSEFTPPVIFTQQERAKLVWMVEVTPDTPEQFRIGQPVKITW
ncbi:MAG: hypothetical protein COA47_07535 [Robiginitomaculum sp.]|nr:MAG: hypothetical protein COA47_07535 [Robiginitomaculum sp.]